MLSAFAYAEYEGHFAVKTSNINTAIYCVKSEGLSLLISQLYFIYKCKIT